MCQPEHDAATAPLGPAGGASARTDTTNCDVTNVWGAPVRPARVGGRLRVSPVGTSVSSDPVQCPHCGTDSIARYRAR